MSSASTFGDYSTAQRQQERFADSRWESSLVAAVSGTPDEIYRRLPLFTRHPYRIGDGENQYKDEIRREPTNISEVQIPIATVSKSYSLIQHREVLASVYQALKLVKIDCSGIQSLLLISEYGERMQWSCELPGFGFDPGDGHPIVLQINCLNSVDKTTALEISLSWFRLVCTNGMMFGLAESNLRMRHVKMLNPEDIAVRVHCCTDDVVRSVSPQ
jgi:Domain of unknown function (DUF932)